VKIPGFVIAGIARKLRIPGIAVRMFRVATDLSGLDKSTLPIELLPLNTVQLSRGLLNFTVLQTLDQWVFPFWAEQQYDPHSLSFIPRSHTGLSMNVTHRNWTAVGNPWCPIEPIVDPRGMVTPHPNGWSVDTWLRVDDRSYFPSRADGVQQSLRSGLPIVVSTLETDAIILRLEAYTAGSRFIQRVSVKNTGDVPVAGSLGLAVRPFNPEGVALIQNLAIERGGLDLVINGSQILHFGSTPSRVLLSNRDAGDAAWIFEGKRQHHHENTIGCPFGLANGVAEYFIALGPGEEWRSDLWHDLEPGARSDLPSVEAVSQSWRSLLDAACTCELPDAHIANLLAASHSSLLMSLDGTTVKPGPATYHYFWFRDAAYMLLALDRLGHGALTRNVIVAYPELQESSGMFRSQQGEWDSTGQALWSIWQHAMLTHDKDVLEQLFVPMKKAVGWIDGMREKKQDDPLIAGLLPRGLSAEHLGLADVYYWDTFWSLAGLEAFVRICQIVGKPDEEVRTRMLASILRADLERSIAVAMQSQGISVIPPGPRRKADAGTIGSLAAWYPLQLLAPNDVRMQATVSTLVENWFLQGMFYQPIVHSGLNAYLSLHVAQAYLYSGNGERFWQILKDVCQKTSPTYTYPEAIHPFTGGGSMGDGHHAWASAEVVLAIRNAFVLERWTVMNRHHTLTFLGGIPRELFDEGEELGIRNAPVPEGFIDIAVSPKGREITIAIEFRKAGFVPEGAWCLSLPSEVESASSEGGKAFPLEPTGGRQRVAIPARTQRITCVWGKRT